MFKPQLNFRVFVIETEGRGIVAFEARSFREASELPKERWFRDELMSLRSNASPVWDGKSTLSTRSAENSEIAEFHNAKSRASTSEADELVLAYLIPLDGSV